MERGGRPVAVRPVVIKGIDLWKRHRRDQPGGSTSLGASGNLLTGSGCCGFGGGLGGGGYLGLLAGVGRGCSAVAAITTASATITTTVAAVAAASATTAATTVTTAAATAVARAALNLRGVGTLFNLL